MTIVCIDPVDMVDLTPVLAAIPSGTVADPTVVQLPAGEYETDVTMTIEDKAFWNVVGGPTVLQYPTYGQLDRETYSRRHVWLRSLSDFHLSGLSIHGPHTARSSDPTRADYHKDKAFQHGVAVANSRRVVLSHIDIVEVGGDGLYLATGCDDITVADYRVEFNGRQGLAGIGGSRWNIERLNVVNSGRYAIDLEPIGNWPDGERRSIDSVEISDSTLTGGVILHRVSSVTLRNNRLSHAIIVGGTSVDSSQRRWGVRILDNVWPDLWSSNSKDAAPIQLSSVNGVEVRRNRITRDPTDSHTRNSTFVEMRTLPVTGHLIVRDNAIENFVAPFRWRPSLDPAGYASVTTDLDPV